MSKLELLALPVLLVACGDNLKGNNNNGDGGGDANNFPNPPALGAQIDRFGRPAINTALDAVLDVDPTKDQKKDAYNQATDPATWGTTDLGGTTVTAEFLKYIAIYDMLDAAAAQATTGCGNNGIANADLAAVLVDDQMYVDTGKGVCGVYLSLEAEAASGGFVTHMHCGGRTLTDDIADVSYSFLFGGLTNGFTPDNGNFIPKFGDGASAHTDVDNDTFPFLGAPH